jgi:aerobic-type carbon monoxide dehydrogenase small subunit (CoxS/CutS family)
MNKTQEITLWINDVEVTADAPVRMTLADFLRHKLDLTGTHLGCEHGVCGACTILMDGVAIRSCLTLAVQAAGRKIDTIEGMADPSAPMHPLQVAFHSRHALQCGFCTPGILMTLIAFLAENKAPSEEEIKLAISGNLCRCTGYQNIVDAVLEYLETNNLREESD